MTDHEARQIIATVEDEHTERKLGANSFSMDKVLAYTAALANEGGGNLIIGVNNDGSIEGTRAFTNRIQQIKNDIYSSLTLSKRMRVAIHEFILDNKRVLIFQIPSRPVGEAVAYKGAYLMRAGESLVAMDFETLSRISDERSPDFSATFIEGTQLTDLDTQAIEIARRLWIQKSGNSALLSLSHKGILQALELIDDTGRVTVAALVLMATEEATRKFLPNNEVVWEYRKHSSDIAYRARTEFKYGFLLYVDKLWQLIDSRNEVAHIQEGFVIRDLKAFSEDVLREAILNAIAHREYTDQGSVYIRQSSEEIIVTSPGGFVPGVTPENIIEVSSRPRNRRIAEVFQKLGLVERSGQGADKIFQQTIAEGKGLPNYAKSDPYSVVLEIGAQIQDLAFLRYLEQVTKEAKIRLGVQDYILLERIRQSLDITTDGKRLEKLVDHGLIERIGRGRSSRLILSKKYYAAFGKQGEYTRRRGLDKHTNIELILKHLKLHKKGYAKDIEEVLPHLSRQTINRYLRELADDGKIKAVGNLQITRGRNRGHWELCD